MDYEVETERHKMVKRIEPENWTNQNINAFWNWYESQPHLTDTYFTFQVGEGLANFLENFTSLKDLHILDYGCGTGNMSEILLDRRAQCYAVDLSENSINTVNKNFSSYSNWNGGKLVTSLPSDYSADFFDVIICVETIEHLSNELITKMLTEFGRIIKPDGFLFITTPNNENLGTNYTYCPFCDSEYHNMQHLQSFSPDRLNDVLDENGFSSLFCQGLNFSNFQRGNSLPTISNWSMRSLLSYFVIQTIKMLDQINPRKMTRQFKYNLRANAKPHLCAISKLK